MEPRRRVPRSKMFSAPSHGEIVQPLIRIWSPARSPNVNEAPSFYPLTQEQEISKKLAAKIDEVQAWAAKNDISQINFVPYRQEISEALKPEEGELIAGCHCNFLSRAKLPDNNQVSDAVSALTGIGTKLYTDLERWGGVRVLANRGYTVLAQRGESIGREGASHAERK